MSYGRIATCTHKVDVNGTETTFTIDVLKKSYPDAASEFLGWGEVFSLEYDRINTREPFRNPINKSRMEFYVTIENENDLALITEIFAGGEDDYQLRLKKDGNIIWTGWVLQDLLQYSNGDYPYKATIIAKDLTRLSQYTFPLQDARQKLIVTIADLLDDIGLGLDIRTYTNWVNDSFTTSDDFLNLTWHETSAMRDYKESGYEDDVPQTNEFWLEAILRNFGLILRQANGSWRIYQLSGMEDSEAVKEYIYNSSGVQQSSSTQDISATIDSSTTFILPSSMNYVHPAIKQANVIWDHRTPLSGILIPDQFIFDGAGSETYTQFFLSNGTQRVSVGLQVTAGFSSTPPAGDIEASFEIYVDTTGTDYYLNNAGEWVTTPTQITITLSNEGVKTNDPSIVLTATGTFFPDLSSLIPDGADGQFTVKLYSVSGADFTTYRISDFEIINSTDESNSDSLAYSLTQSGNYSYVYDHGTVYFGDGPVNYAKSALRFSSANDDITADGWKRVGEVSSDNFFKLLLREFVDLQAVGLRSLEAEIYGYIGSHQMILYESKHFFMLGGTLTGDGVWRVDYLNIDYSSPTVTFAEYIKKESSQGLSGGSGIDTQGANSLYLQVNNNLSDVASAITSRQNLGVEIGVDVQGFDQNLEDISGLLTTDGNIIVGNGSNFVAESGNTARTSLGLGTGDSPSFAGLTVDTDTLYVDSTNNRVGIGKTDPAYTLDVAGTGNFTGALTAPTLNTGQGDNELYAMDQDVTTGDSPSFVALTLTQSSGTAPMTVSSTTVVTNLNADLLDGQHGSYYLDYANFTGTPPVAGAAGTDGQVQYNNGGSLGGANAIYFDDVNGRVGIGTESPSVALEVSGDGQANSYRGVIRIDNTGTQKWGGIAFPDSVDAADSAANNYYLIGRGLSTSDRVLSIHIPRDNDYGSGAQPRFAIYSTGADQLFNVEAETGNSYHKGNVGIGTTSPDELLTLKKSDRPYIHLVSDTTGTASSDGTFLGFASAAGEFQIRNKESQAVTIHTADQERMRITSGGNVGIGNGITPSEKLEVAGNVILDASNANLKIKAGTTGTKGDIQWTFNTDSTAYVSAGIAYDNRGTDGFLIDSAYPITLDYGQSYIRFSNAGSEKVRIDSSGNVMVGTTDTSPATNNVNGITLNGAASVGLFSRSGSACLETNRISTDGDIVRFRKDGTIVGSIASVATGKIGFYGSGGTGAVIDSSGNVGIGTTNVQAKLHVTGNVYLGNGNYSIRYRTASAWDYYLSAVNDDFSLFDSQNTLFLKAFYNGGGSAKYISFLNTLNVLNNGNVGIGGTPSASKLDIYQASSDALLRLTSTAASTAGTGSVMALVCNDGAAISSGDRISSIIFQGSADSSNTIRSGARISAFADGNYSPTSAPTRMVFETTPSGSSATTERMRITSAGLLQHQGGAVFNESGGNNDFRVEGDTDQNLLFVDASTDRVGIGTSSPATLLEISDSASGTVSTSLNLRNSAEAVDSSSNIYFSTGSGLTAGNITSIIRSVVTQASPSILKSDLAIFTNSGDSVGERMRITSGGTVGINSISPNTSYNLYVNGSTYSDTIVSSNVTASFMSKGSGSFRIPHPDPAKPSKELWHSFVESPNAGDNLYRYQVEVKDGIGTVLLPDYYKHLNDNDQVWVSPVKHFGQAYGEVTEDQEYLVIHANQDGLYNVLLIGTRKDETAVKHWKGEEREGDLDYIRSIKNHNLTS